jgi:uncharacterized protein
VRPADYGRFLIEVFEEWVRRDVGQVFVQSFDVALACWMGAPAGLCVFEETCGFGLAMEHNGDVYACDHFVTPEHLLGNIMTTLLADMARSPHQREFGRAKWDALPRICHECEFLFACQGECPRNRFAVGSDGEMNLNYLCEGYRAFFGHIDPAMRAMAALLRAGRAPAEIMGQVAAADADLANRFARAGRNDPCPCGSGRKLKLCHGRSP